MNFRQNRLPSEALGGSLLGGCCCSSPERCAKIEWLLITFEDRMIKMNLCHTRTRLQAMNSTACWRPDGRDQRCSERSCFSEPEAKTNALVKSEGRYLNSRLFSECLSRRNIEYAARVQWSSRSSSMAWRLTSRFPYCRCLPPVQTFIEGISAVNMCTNF